MEFLQAATFGVIGSAAVLSAGGTGAVTASVFDNVVYAGRDIRVESFTTLSGAPTHAGNNFTNNGDLHADSLVLGGSFLSVPAAFESVIGDITAGGDVTDFGGPGASVGGSIFAGGSVSTQGSINVAGSITASGDVTQPFSISTIQGGVTTGGFANIQGEVLGTLTYNAGFELGTFAFVGDVQQGGPVAPPVYAPPAMPTPRSFSPGATDVTLANFQDLVLDPGHYGTLQFASSNTVTLTAGEYFFDDIDSTFALNELAFDTSAGPISVFIDGDFDFRDLVQVINGEALFAGGNPDPADAAGIYFEVTGSFTVAEELYGTVFAPNGDITVETFADVTGSLIAGRDVNILGSADVTYVRVSVPEPASATAFGLAVVLLARRRR